jgi:small subunit ribosomal protein S15
MDKKEVEFENPAWLKIKPSEIESLIIKLSEEGNSPEKIGLILRDKHSIPSVKAILNKRISQVILSKNQEFKTNILDSNLQNKITTLKTHLSANKLDHSAHTSLTKKLWAQQKLQALQSN